MTEALRETLTWLFLCAPIIQELGSSVLKDLGIALSADQLPHVVEKIADHVRPRTPSTIFKSAFKKSVKQLRKKWKTETIKDLDRMTENIWKNVRDLVNSMTIDEIIGDKPKIILRRAIEIADVKLDDAEYEELFLTLKRGLSDEIVSHEDSFREIVLQSLQVMNENLSLTRQFTGQGRLRVYRSLESLKLGFDALLGGRIEVIERDDARKLAEELAKKKLKVVVEGPPFIGKSCVAYLVAKHWIAKGKSVAMIRGEMLPADIKILQENQDLLLIIDSSNLGLSWSDVPSQIEIANRALVVRRFGDPRGINVNDVRDYLDSFEYTANISEKLGVSKIRLRLGQELRMDLVIASLSKEFAIVISDELSEDFSRICKGPGFEPIPGLARLLFIFLKKLIDQGSVRSPVLATDVEYAMITLSKLSKYEAMIKQLLSWLGDDIVDFLVTLKFLQPYLGYSNVFLKETVESTHHAYHKKPLEERILRDLKRLSILMDVGDAPFYLLWHGFLADVVELQTSHAKLILTIKDLTSDLEKILSTTPTNNLLRLDTGRIEWDVDPKEAIRNLKRCMTVFEIRFVAGEFLAVKILDSLDLDDLERSGESMQKYFELLGDDEYGNEIKINVLSTLPLLVGSTNLIEYLARVNKIALHTIQKMPEPQDGLHNFYSMCIAKIIESSTLNDAVKENYIGHVDNMAIQAFEGIPNPESGFMNYFSMRISKTASPKSISLENKKRWISYLNNKALEVIHRRSNPDNMLWNYYSLAISHIATSKFIEEQDKDLWVAYVDNMATQVFSSLRNPLEHFSNYYSMCIAKIIELTTIANEDKEKLTIHLDRKIFQKVQERPNPEDMVSDYYAGCIIHVIESQLLQNEEKEQWINWIEMMANRTFEKMTNREILFAVFYSMSIVKTAGSPLVKDKDKEDWAVRILIRAEETGHFSDMMILKTLTELALHRISLDSLWQMMIARTLRKEELRFSLELMIQQFGDYAGLDTSEPLRIVRQMFGPM